MEMLLAYVTGEVEPNQEGAKPFKVVFRTEDGIISTQEVATRAEGERLINEMLQGLGAFAEREGYK